MIPGTDIRPKNTLFQSVLIGYLMALLASLPVSPVNLTLLQVGLEAGLRQALWFASGMILVEALFIRFSLGGLLPLLQKTNVRRLLERLTLVLLVGMAAFSLWQALNPAPGGGGFFTPASSGNGFLLGALFRLLNPGMILFWVGANSMLITRQKLPPEARHFNFYTLGGLGGVASALALYIFWGSYLSDYLRLWYVGLQLAIGLFFLAAAAWLIVKQGKLALRRPAG